MSNEDGITFFYSETNAIGYAEQNMAYYNALRNIEKELSTLNVNRGGNNTFGFVFEDMHASNKNLSNMKMHNGEIIQVLGDNGIADFKVIDANGNTSYQQAKVGYQNGRTSITAEKYNNQTLVFDKGNEDLSDYLKNSEVPSEESVVSKEQAQNLAEKMKLEGKMRKTLGLDNTAPITSKLYMAAKQMQAAHQVGLDAAKGAAALTAGISFGKNLYAFMEGNMELRDMLINTAQDTAKTAISAYASGAASYIVSGVVSEVIVSTGIGATAVGTAVGTTLLSVGSLTAAISAAAGPVFLIGMAIGTGYAMCKTVKAKNKVYRQKKAQMNHAIAQALQSMQAAYNSLEQDLKDYCDFWDASLGKGFNTIQESVLRNDFVGFSKGLDMVLSFFDTQVLFKTEKDFDEFFFDDNAVLTL